MDWGALMPAAPADSGTPERAAEGDHSGPPAGAPEGGRTGGKQAENPENPDLFPLVPNSKGICSRSLSNKNNDVPNVPVVPMFFSGAGPGDGSETSAAGGGAGLDFLRARKSKGAGRHRLSPAAVVMLIAWCDHTKMDRADRIDLLEALRDMPPGEQVAVWHRACEGVGLQPWKLLNLPAPDTGEDCCSCAHLVSRTFQLDGSRRRFHWGCALGYLLHEYGRGSERIWIAPPECDRFERWYPGDRR